MIRGLLRSLSGHGISSEVCPNSRSVFAVHVSDSKLVQRSGSQQIGSNKAMVPARPPPRVALQATENTRTAALCCGPPGEADSRGTVVLRSLFNPVNSKKRPPQQPQGSQSQQDHDGHPLQAGQQQASSGVVHSKTGAKVAGRGNSGVCSKRVKTSEEVSADVSQDRGILNATSGGAGSTSGVMVKPPRVSSSATRTKIPAAVSLHCSKSEDGGLQKNVFHSSSAAGGANGVLGPSAATRKLTTGAGRSSVDAKKLQCTAAENAENSLSTAADGNTHNTNNAATKTNNSNRNTDLHGTDGEERQPSASSQQSVPREPFADFQKNLSSLSHEQQPLRGGGKKGVHHGAAKSQPNAATASASITTASNLASRKGVRGGVLPVTLDSTVGPSSLSSRNASSSSSLTRGSTTRENLDGDGATGSHGVSDKSILRGVASKPSLTRKLMPAKDSTSLHAEVKIVAVAGPQKGDTSSSEDHCYSTCARAPSSILQPHPPLARKNGDAKSSAGVATHALRSSNSDVSNPSGTALANQATQKRGGVGVGLAGGKKQGNGFAMTASHAPNGSKSGSSSIQRKEGCPSNERLVRLCDRDDDIWNEWEGVRLLGEGVYGRVYLVKHKDSGEERAFKRMYLQTSRVGGTGWIDESVASGGVPAVVQREVSTLKALRNSSNVIRLEEVLVGSRRVYLSFPVIHGGSLSELMRRYASWQEHLLFLHQSQVSSSNTPSSIVTQEEDEEDEDHPDEDRNQHQNAAPRNSRCTDLRPTLVSRDPSSATSSTFTQSSTSSSSSSCTKKEDDAAMSSSSSLSAVPTNNGNLNQAHSSSSSSTTTTATTVGGGRVSCNSSDHDSSPPSSPDNPFFTERKQQYHHQPPIIFPPPFTYPTMPPCGLPLALCKTITQAILRGVAACHEHRIAHRDLKPDNILVEWIPQQPPCPPPPPPSPVSTMMDLSDKKSSSHTEDEDDTGRERGDVTEPEGNEEERKLPRTKATRYDMNHHGESRNDGTDCKTRADHPHHPEDGGDHRDNHLHRLIQCNDDKNACHTTTSSDTSDNTIRTLQAAASQLLRDLGEGREKRTRGIPSSSSNHNGSTATATTTAGASTTTTTTRERGEKQVDQNSSSSTVIAVAHRENDSLHSGSNSDSKSRRSSLCVPRRGGDDEDAGAMMEEGPRLSSCPNTTQHSSQLDCTRHSSQNDNENQQSGHRQCPPSAHTAQDSRAAGVGAETRNDGNREISYTRSATTNTTSSQRTGEEEEEEGQRGGEGDEYDEESGNRYASPDDEQKTESSHDNSNAPSYPPLPLKLVIADFGLARTLPFHLSPSVSSEQHLTATTTKANSGVSSSFSSSAQHEQKENQQPSPSPSVPPSMQQQRHRTCSSRQNSHEKKPPSNQSSSSSFPSFSEARHCTKKNGETDKKTRFHHDRRDVAEDDEGNRSKNALFPCKSQRGSQSVPKGCSSALSSSASSSLSAESRGSDSNPMRKLKTNEEGEQRRESSEEKDVGIEIEEEEESHDDRASSSLSETHTTPQTTTTTTTFALSPEIITLNYRPLDVLLGSNSYSLCVDVWSAGCILMELLTGTELIDGCSEFQCIMAIMKLFGNPWRKQKDEKTKQQQPLLQQKQTTQEASSRKDQVSKEAENSKRKEERSRSSSSSSSNSSSGSSCTETSPHRHEDNVDEDLRGRPSQQEQQSITMKKKTNEQPRNSAKQKKPERAMNRSSEWKFWVSK